MTNSGFAGVWKRIKQTYRKMYSKPLKILGKVEQYTGDLANKVMPYVTPIINQVPVVGPAISYVAERFPDVFIQQGKSIENIGKGENILKNLGDIGLKFNEKYPANPIGFGYNLTQSFKEGGVKGVVSDFGPEIKLTLDMLRSTYK